MFQSASTANKVRAELENRLHVYAGKKVGVFVRTASEMAAIVRNNPFPKAAPNRTLVIFLNEPPPSDALVHAVGLREEEIRLGAREIYIHYGDGMATSKLRIPAAKTGTARNINTITKLAEMAIKLKDC